MMDLYLVATLRMRELQREAELARLGRPEPALPSRLRIALARRLMGAAERLWPEVGHPVAGGAR
jgi:hypothetical protein